MLITRSESQLPKPFKQRVFQHYRGKADIVRFGFILWIVPVTTHFYNFGLIFHSVKPSSPIGRDWKVSAVAKNGSETLVVFPGAAGRF